MLLAGGELTVGALNPGEADNVVAPGGSGSQGPGADSIDVIVFDPDVFGEAGATINLTDALPELHAGGDFIDGGGGIVNVDGSDLPGESASPGITIISAGNTVRALRMYNFTTAAIRITGENNIIGPGNVLSANGFGLHVIGLEAQGNRIVGNLLGTDPGGTKALGNHHAIWMDGGAHDNVIGGVTPGERNIISGSSLAGVQLWGASNNRVIGNYIGTDITGMRALANSRGVRIDVQGSNNIIGGTTPEERNVISGNGFGVELSGTSTQANRIIGNYIGVDVTGTVALGNGTGVVMGEGVGVSATGEVIQLDGPNDNFIGGLEPGEGNVISGNQSAAVSIAESRGNRIIGNFIGTDPEGVRAIANGSGISLTGLVQETVIGPANVISGNLRQGVFMTGEEAFDNRVIGNIIGADATGTNPLGNGEHGLVIRGPAKDNVIGGDEEGQGNIIAFNGGHGIMLEKTSGNAVSGNSIFDNAGESIKTVNRGDIGLSVYMIRGMSPPLPSSAPTRPPSISAA